MVYLTIGLCFSIAALVAVTYLHYREKKELFDRFMAQDFSRYMYHKQIQPVEVDNFKKNLKVKTEKTEAQIERERAAEGF